MEFFGEYFAQHHAADAENLQAAARPLPQARLLQPEDLHQTCGHIAVALDDRLMILWGGYYHSEQDNERYCPSNQIFVYDTLSDKWFLFTTSGLPPEDNSGSCAVLVGTALYIFGGFCEEDDDFAHLYRLDLRTLSWSHVSPESNKMPSVRHKLVGWHYNNKLYYFGGFGPPPYMRSPNGHLLQLSPLEFICDNSLHFTYAWNNQLISFDLETSQWEQLPLVGNAPSHRAAHSAVFFPERSKVLVCGGRLQDRRMNDVYLLDLPSMTWTKIETNDGPCGRSWHTTVAVDADRILLFGGFGQDCNPLDDSWFFDIEQSTWTQLNRPSAKKPRLWHSAVGINGTCYVYGGCKNNILALNPRREFANDMIVIESSPKPLLQQCLNFVSTRCYDRFLGHFTDRRITQLPGPLYEKLQFIASTKRQKSVKTPIDILRF